MAVVQVEDVLASLAIIWMASLAIIWTAIIWNVWRSTIKNCHGIASLDFAMLSGCYQLVIAQPMHVEELLIFSLLMFLT